MLIGSTEPYAVVVNMSVWLAGENFAVTKKTTTTKQTHTQKQQNKKSLYIIWWKNNQLTF